MIRAAILVIVFALTARAGVPPPRASVSAEGLLTITLPAPLLALSEVKQQLVSGLTTVFTVAVSAADQRTSAKGGARIEIRYELWEEKFLVSVIDLQGSEVKLSFPSEQALADWWGSNALKVSPVRFVDTVTVEVRLRMLPFSRQEQNATRRWLSRTLSGGSGQGESSPAESAEILRIIVETSVQRRPLLEFKWNVRAQKADRR